MRLLNRTSRNSARLSAKGDTMTTEAMAPAEKTDPILEAKRKAADETNKARTGVGTRVHVGKTRGKGSVVVQWEAFDESQPNTLPKSVAEFVDVVKVPQDKVDSVLLEYLIEGYNAIQQTAASDPIAEYINPSWSDDVQNQFRLVVRNYAKGTSSTIDAAAELLKPAFDKAHSA